MFNHDSNLDTPNSQGEESIQLSPAITHYIRQLLRQNLDQLTAVSSGSELKASSPSSSSALIESLSLEGLEGYKGVVHELEHLALLHQALSGQGSTQRRELQRIEAQIFRLLGFNLEICHRGTILVVDDTPDNLQLLSAALTQQGYEVCSAINGALALAGVRDIKPDLILLDVMMPELDGYEVCERLKADSLTRSIPVMFLSAVDDVLDKVKAFGIGGVDYITKPFQIEEVMARVEHQLSLQSLRKRLEGQNIRLQQEVQERQQAEERYRSIFENAIDGIFQATLDGRYLRVNQALATLFGYDSPEEIIATVTDIAQQLYVQPRRRAEFIAYIKHYETVSDFDSQIYRKDGSIIWISENVRTVKDTDGNPQLYEGIVKNITDRKQAELELRRERLKTERLLLNILPQQIAERLKQKQTVIADHFAEVTVLFADIVDFTALAVKTTPTQLVSLLNQIFSAFDQLVEQYGLEKIKTIGDAYMAVGGLPVARTDHAEAIAEMALAMQQTLEQACFLWQSETSTESIAHLQQNVDCPFRLRIGVNTGPVIAGVIGKKKFSYDLWGDTVNIASRMESEGVAGKIQVTAATYEYLKNQYRFEPRGTVLVKGRGAIVTYWLLGKNKSGS